MLKTNSYPLIINLKDGISNDRLGYLILKREKVIDLLEIEALKIFIHFIYFFLLL